MAVIIWGLYRFTKFGIATRAAEEKKRELRYLDTPAISAGANWVLASITAGIAGILFLHKTQPAQIACSSLVALRCLFGTLLQFLAQL